MQENLGTNKELTNKCIIINLSNSTRFIRVRDIVMLQAEGSYCTIFLKGGEKLLASKNLKYFEERLTDFPQFFRCHKSYMVNRMYIQDYVRSDGGYLILKNKVEIPISSEKVDEFLEGAKMVRR